MTKEMLGCKQKQGRKKRVENERAATTKGPVMTSDNYYLPTTKLVGVLKRKHQMLVAHSHRIAEFEHRVSIPPTADGATVDALVRAIFGPPSAVVRWKRNGPDLTLAKHLTRSHFTFIT